MTNGLKILAIFAKRSILDIWQGSEHTSDFDTSFYT